MKRTIWTRLKQLFCWHKYVSYGGGYYDSCKKCHKERWFV